MSVLIDVASATFGYGQGKNFIPIVSEVTFSLSIGEFVLLAGPNGCGKSSIIRGLFGLVSQPQGTISWHIPRNQIGYIPQESTIDYDIPATALDVVRTSQPYTWGTNRDEGREALDMVGMTRHAAKRFGALSGGQKRRILLARALFGKPRLLVLDEPTVNTDRETEMNMETLLFELCASQQVGVMATTHSESWAKKALRRYHIEEGVFHA